MFALRKKKIGTPYEEIVGLFEDEETAREVQELLDPNEIVYGGYYYRVNEYSLPPIFKSSEEAYRKLR